MNRFPSHLTTLEIVFREQATRYTHQLSQLLPAALSHGLCDAIASALLPFKNAKVEGLYIADGSVEMVWSKEVGKDSRSMYTNMFSILHELDTASLNTSVLLYICSH